MAASLFSYKVKTGDPNVSSKLNDLIDALEDQFTNYETQAEETLLQTRHAKGHTQPDFRILGDGDLQWGQGGEVAPEVTLQRIGSEQMQFNSELRASRIINGDSSFATVVSGDSVVRFVVRSSGKLEWGPGNGPLDVSLERVAQDVISLGTGDGLQFNEAITDLPAPAAANRVRLYLREDGAGKTQLVARFSSGAVQVIATQV